MVLAMASGSYREIGNFEVADKYIKESFITIASEYGEESIPAAVILNSMGMLYKK